MIDRICSYIVSCGERYREKQRRIYLNKHNINPDNITAKVRLINPQNIVIGPNTYMNAGFLDAGKTAKIVIGDWCAIGYNVSIKALTHNKQRPTGTFLENDEGFEASITIGDHVWIGDNVYIREGVNIGSNVTIGANSVVTKDVPSNSVFAGAPAAFIKNR